MSRRGNRYSAGVNKSHGTPVGEPQPQAIDDYSGFKVPLGELKKDWQGLLTVSPDIRSPQDFVRGVKDDQSLPYSRPESADTFIALPITWESGAFITSQQGNDIYHEGIQPGQGL